MTTTALNPEPETDPNDFETFEPVFSDPELSALIVVIDRLFSRGGIEGKEAHAMGALRTKLVSLLQMTEHTQKE